VEHHATLQLVPGLRAPHAAREFTGETLSAWGVRTPDVEAVQLVVSELVTNALRHAPESPTITLQLLTREGAVQVRVSDRGHAAPERRSPPDPGTGIESGRGVWIVDAFTDHWGTEPDGHGGKTVWCEVPAERASRR
jgi:anti-sigma regulatory factor (Ser/Thr protein kinase)